MYFSSDWFMKYTCVKIHVHVPLLPKIYQKLQHKTGGNRVWLRISVASWSVYAYSERQGSTAANDPRNLPNPSVVPCRLPQSFIKNGFCDGSFLDFFFRRTSAPMPWPTRRWILKNQREAGGRHQATSQSPVLCMLPPGRAWYSLKVEQRLLNTVQKSFVSVHMLQSIFTLLFKSKNQPPVSNSHFHHNRCLRCRKFVFYHSASTVWNKNLHTNKKYRWFKYFACVYYTRK